jgi:hypothetical protein
MDYMTDLLAMIEGGNDGSGGGADGGGGGPIPAPSPIEQRWSAARAAPRHRAAAPRPIWCRAARHAPRSRRPAHHRPVARPRAPASCHVHRRQRHTATSDRP